MTARAEVVVDATPAEAFDIFTNEIGFWWRQHTPYWNDSERGLYLRIEAGVGGRFVEVYDADSDTGFQVGEVTVWEPGERLGLTWRQASWPAGVTTDVDVRFEPVAGRTRVRVEHRGFERVGAEPTQVSGGYEAGWQEVLGWFAERVDARR